MILVVCMSDQEGDSFTVAVYETQDAVAFALQLGPNTWLCCGGFVVWWFCVVVVLSKDLALISQSMNHKMPWRSP